MTKGTIWTASRWERAQLMRGQGADDCAIAAALHLTERQVDWKFANEGYRKRSAQREIAPLFTDRDQRAAAADRRTKTQVFFGDPPPGYSALDQKRTQKTPS